MGAGLSLFIPVVGFLLQRFFARPSSRPLNVTPPPPPPPPPPAPPPALMVGAAPVGQIECTQVVKSYPHPKAPHVVFWDFPGAGTKSHPAATYFSDKKLIYAFDAILILTGDCFLEVDLEILKAALSYGKPCAFVRTKCDTAVASALMNATDKIQAIEASMRFRKDVENSFRSCLKQVGLADYAYQEKCVLGHYRRRRRRRCSSKVGYKSALYG